MNTPKLVHARGSLHLKIINSNQGDSFFTRYLGVRVQNNSILFHSPEDGGGWSDFHDLLRRWFSNIQGIKVSATGQITLDALPATPLPAFYGLELGYTTDKITLSIGKKESFAEGPQFKFSDLNLEFVDERKKALVEASGSVDLTYRGQSPLALAAELNASEGLQFVLPNPDLADLAQSHPFLTDFETQSLKVVSTIKRWDGLQVLYTFGEGGGNLVYDYAGSGAVQNMRIVSRNMVSWSDEGLTLKVNYSDLSKNPKITAEKNARHLVEACQRSEEISIEAWIKTDEIRQVGPAEIISLEKNERKRNFALGQGPEERISKGRTARSVGNFLNARISTTETDRDGEPGMQSPQSSFGVIHTHVVFTRDSRGNAAMFINGVCIQSGSIRGSFEDWEKDVKLILGNDTRKKGPWAGELYQIAIYNQALTEQEVRAHYVPQVYVEGKAKLSSVPSPLDEVLQANWEILPETSILNLKGDHKVLSPQLHFEDISLSLLIDAKGGMTPKGTIKTALWGNLFNMVPSKTGGATSPWPNLTMHSPGIATLFDFDGLGRVSMQKFKLIPTKTTGASPTLTWKSDDRAGIILHDFPDVVDGISDIDLSFPNQEIWLSISNHNHSLAFIQDLNIVERAKKYSRGKGEFQFGPIRIDRKAGEWIVTALKDTKSIVTSKSSLGGTFSPKHLDYLASLIQPATVGKDSTNADKQISLFIGSWQFPNKTDLRMAVGFMKRVGNGFSLEAELDKNKDEVDFIRLWVEGCYVFGDRTNSPIVVEGKSELSLLNGQGSELNKIFEGDVCLNEKGDRFLLTGDISLFPVWAALSVKGPGTISILKTGVVSLDETVQFQMEDFRLIDPRLKMTNGGLKLSGYWLGKERLTFEGTRRSEPTQTDSFVLITEAKFENLPFQITIDPVFDPITGDQLSEDIVIKDAFMNIGLDVELSERGFHAKVSANFEWPAEKIKIDIPEFQIFWPPRTRNELLSIVLDELRNNASEIFAPQFKTADAYFLENNSGASKLRYGLFAPSGAPIKIPLPKIFATSPTADPKSDNDMFVLKTNNNLEISIPAGTSAADVKSEYKTFLESLESISTNLPREGALTLIQSRIAEQLPMPIEDVLFYHYGLDKAKNQVDLKPGMRLRVEYQNYQFVPRSDKRAIQGFVGSGSAIYEVNHFHAAGGTKLSFDPFMTGMQTKVSGVNGSNQIGGLLDLSSAGLKSFYRLKFPPEFADPSINSDSIRATHLIGADTYADLNDGLSALKRNLLGRAIIIPEILVYVDGNPVYIPLGTSLRQLLERSSALPAVGLIADNTPTTGFFALSFNLSRLVHEGLNGKPIHKPIDLGNYAKFTSGTDLFDLPLVKGDRINF